MLIIKLITDFLLSYFVYILDIFPIFLILIFIFFLIIKEKYFYFIKKKIKKNVIFLKLLFLFNAFISFKKKESNLIKKLFFYITILFFLKSLIFLFFFLIKKIIIFDPKIYEIIKNIRLFKNIDSFFFFFFNTSINSFFFFENIFENAERCCFIIFKNIYFLFDYFIIINKFDNYLSDFFLESSFFYNNSGPSFKNFCFFFIIFFFKFTINFTWNFSTGIFNFFLFFLLIILYFLFFITALCIFFYQFLFWDIFYSVFLFFFKFFIHFVYVFFFFIYFFFYLFFFIKKLGVFYLFLIFFFLIYFCGSINKLKKKWEVLIFFLNKKLASPIKLFINVRYFYFINSSHVFSTFMYFLLLLKNDLLRYWNYLKSAWFRFFVYFFIYFFYDFVFFGFLDVINYVFITYLLHRIENSIHSISWWCFFVKDLALSLRDWIFFIKKSILLRLFFFFFFKIVKKIIVSAFFYFLYYITKKSRAAILLNHDAAFAFFFNFKNGKYIVESTYLCGLFIYLNHLFPFSHSNFYLKVRKMSDNDYVYKNVLRNNSKFYEEAGINFYSCKSQFEQIHQEKINLIKINELASQITIDKIRETFFFTKVKFTPIDFFEDNTSYAYNEAYIDGVCANWISKKKAYLNLVCPVENNFAKNVPQIDYAITVDNLI